MVGRVEDKQRAVKADFCPHDNVFTAEFNREIEALHHIFSRRGSEAQTGAVLFPGCSPAEDVYNR